MLHTVVFIGRSGCGKGTQAELLRNRIKEHDLKKRQILYIETGDGFREFVRGKSLSSRLSKAIYDRDARQPDFLATMMWGKMLLEQLDEEMHLVFDGVARSKAEAHMLSTALWFYEREKPTIIYINVSRKWSEEKLLKRGRADDVNLARIDKRLDWFDKDVIPSIEYFKENPFFRVIEVNGEQSVEAVHAELISKYEYSE
ncbi:MAG TPA: nucleoside monophosphate kinase [Parcubacteria group bacterium]|nr:nucleoside monophosphate kinase [Parcubacteria group bacterium]